MGAIGGVNAVETVGLTRRFGSTEAVCDLSLSIEKGETFGLLGPNGAGKTTTLAMLATLLTPTAGDARIFGLTLSRDIKAVRRFVGLAPQEISLYPDLSAEENLLFFGRLYGLSGGALKEKVDGLLALVGLTARRGDRVQIYSGGMKRRLNLACSLVHDPQLVLLDEPTAGVDAQSRERIFDAIEEITREGATVVYTTHYMEEAERLCDRIAVMDEGRIVAMGTLSELLEIVGMGEVIDIRTSAPLDEGRFRFLPGLITSEKRAGLTRLVVDNAARSLAQIAAVVAEHDAQVEGVEIYRVNLERVFMHLTGKALRD